MAKTTVLIDVNIGAQVPPTTAWMVWEAPFAFDSGNTLVLPAGANVKLVNGQGQVEVDGGIWKVTSVAPGFIETQALRVPESDTPVQFNSLVEETDKNLIGFGPTWAARAELSALSVLTSVAESQGYSDAAKGYRDAAQAILNAIPATTDAQVAARVDDEESITRASLRMWADQLYLSAAELADQIENPETAASNAVSQLITTALEDFTPTTDVLRRQVIGANLSTARMDYAGPVDWWTTVVAGRPDHMLGFDSVTEYDPEPVPDQILWADTFTRADNLTSLGVTSSGGKTWEVLTPAGADPVFGIVGNQAKVVSGSTGRGLAVADAGVARQVFEAKMPLSVNRQAGIAFRVVDISNFYQLTRVAQADAHYRLVRYTNGSASSTLFALAASIANDDVIKIDDLVVGQLKIYVNGVLQFDEVANAVPITSFLTATKQGFAIASVAASTGGVGSLWDNASVTRPA